jgi:hypothetical protein
MTTLLLLCVLIHFTKHRSCTILLSSPPTPVLSPRGGEQREGEGGAERGPRLDSTYRGTSLISNPPPP